MSPVSRRYIVQLSLLQLPQNVCCWPDTWHSWSRKMFHSILACRWTWRSLDGRTTSQCVYRGSPTFVNLRNPLIRELSKCPLYRAPCVAILNSADGEFTVPNLKSVVDYDLDPLAELPEVEAKCAAVSFPEALILRTHFREALFVFGEAGQSSCHFWTAILCCCFFDNQLLPRNFKTLEKELSTRSLVGRQNVRVNLHDY